MSPAAYGSVELSARLVRPRVALVGRTVVGIETQFRNVSTTASALTWLEPVIVSVNPYQADDVLERRFRFLPANTRGTLRSVPATAPLFTHQGMAAVWTQVDLPLIPWQLARNGFAKIPVLYSTDCTPQLLYRFGHHYEVSTGRSSAKRFLRDVLLRFFLRRVTWVNAWTHWAARSLEDDYGVPSSRIHVVPPGVDLSFWRPPDRSKTDWSSDPRHPARLLFVGGDFERKGGDLLLDIYRHQLRGKVEMEVVTKIWDGATEPGVTVHTGLRPNDTRLVDLYRRADIFVLPTRADCFSVAAVEALASGVPVVICSVGGIADLLNPGVQGFFVQPDDGRELTQAILALVNDRSRREAMGLAARVLATARYDAAINTRHLFETLLTADPSFPQGAGTAASMAAHQGSR